jgi:hypothetical protein
MTELAADSALMALIARDVDAGGFHIVHTPEDMVGPAITYSIGLWRNFRHPEVAVCALSEEAGIALIDRIGADIAKARRGFMPETVADDLVEGASVTFIAINEDFYEDALDMAVWFYVHHTRPPEQFPAVQAVLPTVEGGFYPWDVDYPQHLERVQPLLGMKR